MSKANIRKITESLKCLLEERGIKVGKIILFGSYTGGNYRSDSDIDVAIVSKDFSRKDIFRRAEMLGDIEWQLVREFSVPFDIVMLSPEEFKKGVAPVVQFARTGKVIYGV